MNLESMIHQKQTCYGEWYYRTLDCGLLQTVFVPWIEAYLFEKLVLLVSLRRVLLLFL